MINAPRRGNLFDTIKVTEPKKSAFDMSFENKLTSNMGYLIPTLCKEILPGDYLELQTSSIVRFAPTLAPILHNVDVTTFTFFVPNRLIWPNWQKFITPGDGTVTMNNAPSYVPPIAPYFDVEDLDRKHVQAGSLLDYLGVNIHNFDPYAPEHRHFSSLPLRAYHLIYDEYFRDQNVTPRIFDPQVDFTDGYEGSDDLKLEKYFTLRKKCWEKDYFTSSLPTAQRGPVVLLPIGTSADIVSKIPAQRNISGIFHANEDGPTQSGEARIPNVTARPFSNVDLSKSHVAHIASINSKQSLVVDSASTPVEIGIFANDTGHTHPLPDDIPLSVSKKIITDNFKVDLSSASSATVETLRNAFKLQEFLEKSARSGARYIESILSHFGVRSSDARLQRPELLGTSRKPVQVSEVTQTSQADNETSPTGTLYGKLTSTYQNDVIRYTAEEHGFLMQLQCVLPRTAYMQGLSRMWTRESYLDYAWPEFAHLGEQEVYNRELFYGTVKDDEVFGYQPRYAEYKYNLDEVHGQFKTSLSYWHLGRKFTKLPTLSTEFLECNPSFDIFAVTDPNVDHLYQEIWHDFKMVRCLPEYGTPHF